MNITPDFSESVESTTEGILPGTYKTRVSGVENKVGQAKGTPYLKLKLTIFGAEGEAARYNNWPVYTNLMLTGKGAGRLKDFLKAVDVPVGPFETETLLGKELVAVLVESKDSNGNTRAWPEVKAVKHI